MREDRGRAFAVALGYFVVVALTRALGQTGALPPVVAAWTGIPVSRLLEGEMQKLVHLEDALRLGDLTVRVGLRLDAAQLRDERRKGATADADQIKKFEAAFVAAQDRRWVAITRSQRPHIGALAAFGFQDRMIQVGNVNEFKPGDLAAVGCMVDSDGTCRQCKAGLEQFCPNMILTFNSPDKHLGGVTYGGYSESIVVDERFVLRVPSNLDLAGTAPLLCAGITTYSPMHHWGVTKGKKVGVVGLGGLGHMAVKFAHAFGAHTVVFTTSPNKKDDALRLGADEVVVSRNADEMQKHAESLDFIIDTVSAPHDLNAYLALLKRDGAGKD